MAKKKKGEKVAVPRKTAKKAPRGKNWTEEEQLHLLEVMEEIMPINPDEWEQVKLKHDAVFGSNGCPISSLQCVYANLTWVVEPTGNPNIPCPVKKAKEVKELLWEKTDGTTGSQDTNDQIINLSLEEDDNDDEDNDDEDNYSDDNDEEDGNGKDDDSNNNEDSKLRILNKGATCSNIGGNNRDNGDDLADFFLW